MLKVNEVFETIQGEGSFTGVPAIFVRLQGCPVGCPWCDTQHTWVVDDSAQIPVTDLLAKRADSPQYSNLTVSDLIQVFAQEHYTARHVVITGGEPCMYDLTDLTQTLHAQGFSTQIETSGTFEVRCDDATWVTVSPKIDMPGGYSVLPSAMARANEVKHPIAMQKHIDDLDALLADNPVRDDVSISLQPISQRPRATELAISTCIQRNWRLSLQTHKYLGIE
ncbi:7-carboxy-7-deazaguanine synthase QueE [Alteromonas flava]|uniref:7-carboxy-7-deazaguanine synthase QueE n=1 Tax=Alteromonas flava TaxID=2048003 RepID=UPI003B833817